MDSILNWYREEGIIFKGGSAPASTCRASGLGREPAGRRHGIGSGVVHAWRRRVGGDDQVGGQDPSGRQDGHPRRRPPRHRGLHLVQGARGAQGPGPARRRVRHGPRRVGLVLHPVPERQQLGAGHRRVHAGRPRRRRLGTHGPNDGSAVRTVKARDLFRQIAQAAWECADPGMQFDTTINRWHTAPNAGRINGSNPCFPGSALVHTDKGLDAVLRALRPGQPRRGLRRLHPRRHQRRCPGRAGRADRRPKPS